MKSVVTDLDLAFLVAAHELSVRQVELYPLLAARLGRDPYDFWVGRLDAAHEGWFRSWRAERQLRWLASGRFDRWAWNFHGLECDVWNQDDGRFVRIDFGPRTRRLVITGSGVLQYVMTVCPPWRCFDVLREFLARGTAPYDRLSGDHAKMSAICDRLERLGLLVYADPKLAALARSEATRDGAGTHDLAAYPMEPYLAQRLVLSPSLEVILGKS